MRMRKKKHLPERLALCEDLLLEEPESLRARFRQTFETRMNKAPETLALEIGCGKGGFILEMAKRRPETAFLAVEICPEALLLAMEKCRDAHLDNVLFLRRDAARLDEVFAPGEIDRIYLNFSDPWPKARHAKRRLTAPSFLKVYRRILRDGGALRQKTDNAALFDFSLESFASEGWRLEDVTRDLHHSAWEKDNVHTEYEDNFSAKGFSINALTAYKD